MSALRLGIYGGSFDPVHNGHVAAAHAFIKEARLDRLAVVPSSLSPFKSSSGASAAQRLKMLELAFAGDGNITPDGFEAQAGGTSYTWKTVAHFRALFPGATLCYMIGDDHLAAFGKWARYDYILENCRIYVANRSGIDIDAAVAEFSRRFGCDAVPMRFTAIEASSTALRASPDPRLLPASVYDYIVREGLYQ